MKNLFLTLTLLFTGIINAQWSFWVAKDGTNAYVTNVDTTGVISTGFWKSDNGDSGILLFNDNLTGVKTVYATYDNGATYVKAQLDFGTGGFANAKDLYSQFETDKFVRATELKFAIDGVIYTVSMDNFVVAFDEFDGFEFNANPFNTDNPFQG